MSKHRKRKTGLKHLSKMEKIKNVKILHYIVPIKNVDGVCLVAETAIDSALFSTKHCFFVEESFKDGHRVRNYSLDNKDYEESMLSKFQNLNAFIEFKDFNNDIKKNIDKYVEMYINMSKYTLDSKAEIFLLNGEECYELISSL